MVLQIWLIRSAYVHCFSLRLPGNRVESPLSRAKVCRPAIYSYIYVESVERIRFKTNLDGPAPRLQSVGSDDSVCEWVTGKSSSRITRADVLTEAAEVHHSVEDALSDGQLFWGGLENSSKRRPCMYLATIIVVSGRRSHLDLLTDIRHGLRQRAKLVTCLRDSGTASEWQ